MEPEVTAADLREAFGYLGLPLDGLPRPDAEDQSYDLTGSMQVVPDLILPAKAMVDGHAPDAPPEIKRVCVLRLVAYGFTHRDGLQAGETLRPADPMRITGVLGLLSPYRVRQAVV